MQIKTTMRYYLTPVRMAIIKKTRDSKCYGAYREKGTLVNCWWDCKFVQPLWKIECRILKKLKIELPYDSIIILMGIYFKENENINLKRYLHPHVHSSIIYCSQDMETI